MKAEKLVANVVYCEDVRNEVGGAQTFVGVARGGVNLPSFPGVMPKFSIVLDVSVDANSPPSPIDFSIVTINDAGQETELVAGSMPFDTEPQGHPPIGRYKSVSAVATFAPFTISEPCGLFVRIAHDGIELVPPGLRFAVNEPLKTGAA